MKVPLSVRELYENLKPRYADLQAKVDGVMQSNKRSGWHYISRLKELESFAQKLETGRVSNPLSPDDFFACTLVVENHSAIVDATTLIEQQFHVIARRPPNPARTHLYPSNFDFDDLRLYAEWKSVAKPVPEIDGRVFEVQIKTFLQHAWSIATHDLVYKTDTISWAKARIAYQVKAMLENAELTISEANKLKDAGILRREDDRSKDLRDTIELIVKKWKPEQLPKDLRRLAENILDLSRQLRLPLSDLWESLDASTKKGRGTETLNISPFNSVVEALIQERSLKVFEPLKKAKKNFRLFLPIEVDFGVLPDDVQSHIVRIGFDPLISPDKRVLIEQYNITQKSDYLWQFWARFEGDSFLLNKGENTSYRAAFRFSKDSQWFVRMQKVASGTSKLFLYKRQEKEIISATTKPLSDLAWEYLKTTPGFQNIEAPNFHLSATLVKGFEDNYVWLNVTWPDSRYIIISLSGDVLPNEQHGQLRTVQGWGCRYDLIDGIFDIPDVVAGKNIEALTNDPTSQSDQNLTIKESATASSKADSATESASQPKP